MKRTLRKGKSHVHVTYKNGDFTNNLWGSHFTLEVRESIVTLEIDLSSNFRVRNKHSNPYVDAVELARWRNQVAFIQIDSLLVLEPLSQAWERVANPKLNLSLLLGEEGAIQYKVKPDARDITVQPNDANCRLGSTRRADPPSSTRGGCQRSKTGQSSQTPGSSNRMPPLHIYCILASVGQIPHEHSNHRSQAEKA